MTTLFQNKNKLKVKKTDRGNDLFRRKIVKLYLNKRILRKMNPI